MYGCMHSVRALRIFICTHKLTQNTRCTRVHAHTRAHHLPLSTTVHATVCRASVCKSPPPAPCLTTLACLLREPLTHPPPSPFHRLTWFLHQHQHQESCQTDA